MSDALYFRFASPQRVPAAAGEYVSIAALSEHERRVDDTHMIHLHLAFFVLGLKLFRDHEV